MATWTFADYVSLPDGPGRLSRLRNHILEVSQAIQDHSTWDASDGHSRSREGLIPYLEQLRKEEMRLLAVPGSGGFSALRLVRGRR